MQNARRCDLVNLPFYQDQKKWKHNLIPVEFSRNNSYRIVNLLINRNHYVLIKRLLSLLGNHNYKFV